MSGPGILEALRKVLHCSSHVPECACFINDRLCDCGFTSACLEARQAISAHEGNIKTEDPLLEICQGGDGSFIVLTSKIDGLKPGTRINLESVLKPRGYILHWEGFVNGSPPGQHFVSSKRIAEDMKESIPEVMIETLYSFKSPV